MKQYADILKYVLNNGEESTDRTGVGTIKTFGNQLRFNLKEGFPLVTGKKIHIKSMVHELLWFISGNTNIKYLQENGVRIWNEWADKNGDLGPVYGKQWRSVTPNNSYRLKELASQMDKRNFETCFRNYHLDRKEAYKNVEHSMQTSRQMVTGIIGQKTIDQLKNAIDTIKKNPDSRRIIVNAWNVSEIDQMALPPCHMFFQFQVSKKGLSCLIYQRSVDTFLGLPFNIASYALLTHMVAQVCDLEVNELIWTGGDIHIYSNHIEQVKEYLLRDTYPLPKLKLNPEIKDIDLFKFEDIEIADYVCGETIKAEVAV